MDNAENQEPVKIRIKWVNVIIYASMLTCVVDLLYILFTGAHPSSLPMLWGFFGCLNYCEQKRYNWITRYTIAVMAVMLASIAYLMLFVAT